ncbi:RagB/SusD family nutrient uptake outer membrane protein [Hymenobacter sp. HMF4947]|uniref:RagB/SusD family nutrient uptake outer membrane protein n=1 Tax=Hymenobacter ginkgonis TaxID=2682976 RepID=A0A7K1TJW0_9BACT|nr:RagB/SusD family nutrient uptake outer membrane protein [Hymenobacter ginkgonis]MVN78697.1 RagB/SusD family nutrient uptake outer membrane protein [Hymenobacter ginkgonis]
MKRLLLLLSVACTLALGGCEKELIQTPISNGSVPDFYKTAADFDQAMTAVYSQLRGYPDREVILSELRSDNIYGISDIGSRDWDPINNFAASLLPINPYVADAWASDFSTIFRANTLLDQLATNGGVTGSLRTRYEGEAKFIRAFMYLDLVRKFGKVPVIDKALIPQDVAQIPRSEVTKVYDLIISDLQTAIANLPTTYTAANVGRPTQYAAKGMLALVYLTRSGPTYGINGPGLASKEYDKALPLLNDVINSAKFSVLPSYPNVFSYTNEDNAEVVFDIQYIANGSIGGSFVNVVIPDAYYTLSGIPFAAGSVGIKPCSTDLITNAYATTDTRKAFTIQPGYTYAGITETRSFYKKYLNPTGRGVSRTDWPINYIVMRYADILMMKAECILNGAGGTPADAAALLTPMRTRAAQPALTTLDVNSLLAERRREFAGENLRWYDLMRSGRVLDVMNAWVLTDDVNGKITRPITPNLLLYPVPQVELSSAPGLYDQNPGY